MPAHRISEDLQTYALLQTPVFVEEFILKYTLDPAIKEFGLEPEPPYGHLDLPRRLRVIDPACGSGHFLLGAFRRLLRAWQDQSGDTDKWVIISRALESVHGVDKNPFAVSIARFRLMVAAMQAGDVKRLTAKVDFPINVAVGDSLIHGRGAPGIQTELALYGDRQTYTHRTEDIDEYIKSVDMLGVGSYHVVVGNPPYITVKDKQENDNYRKAYKSCSGKYALSVPFAERIFQLAIRGAQDGLEAGYTGQITSNSFMKREFGKKLIEEYFPNVDLTYVIDTSGAYIPGHGTPTVILIGRRRYARPASTIRTVLGINGEPGQPSEPSLGLVWQAITRQLDKPNSESEWVSVVDLERHRLAKYPWSLSGGGADELIDAISSARASTPKEQKFAIGFSAITAEDDAFFLPGRITLRRLGLESGRPMVTGEVVRDFGFSADVMSVWPYDKDLNVLALSAIPGIERFLWPLRRVMQRRKRFGTLIENIPALQWYEFGELYRDKLRPPMRIAFAFVATHNHFVLDRGGNAFNRSAPVIKLPEGASENDHLALLGVLNSSTACFWLQQVSYNKGEGGGARVDAGYAAMGSEAWKNCYEFTGTKLEQFPLVAVLPLTFGRELDGLARRLGALEPSAVCAIGIPTREQLDRTRADHENIRGRMIALQEELDWDVYRRYGLLDHTEEAGLIANPKSVPDLKLGERAFEIVMARRMKVGELETEWFTRLGSTPVTEIPVDWPQEYRDVVAKRIEAIERRRDIGLLERPECKRRWQSEAWKKKEQAALRNWLLDRCEDRDLWYVTDHQGSQQPRSMTVNRLADRMRGDADVVSVARLFGGQDADLADVLKEIIADEHVPYLSQFRYAGTGLLKRLLWEKTWDQQREEDRTGQRLDIPVPPKYKKEDFPRISFWNQRGKLDVPKERFISYPGASPDSDDSSLLGWAGWDHREQAHALITLIEERSTTDGWDAEKLTPLLGRTATRPPAGAPPTRRRAAQAVSSSVRQPPPMVGAPSMTCTRRPAAAIVTAAARPFGPLPTTTTLKVRSHGCSVTRSAGSSCRSSSLARGGRGR